MKDYVAVALKYARAAQKSKKHGKWSKLACKRFLEDYKKAKKKSNSYYFDEYLANDPCDFVEKMPHVEGEWDTPTITLHASQIFFIVNIFGFRDSETHARRFSTALWASGRKNGKSTLAAPLGIYCQVCEESNGAQVVSAATTGDQAKIVWNVAKRMVEKEIDLQEYYDIKPYSRTIAGLANGSIFKYISAKASTQDGLNPSCAIIDEVHAHPNHDLINVLKSAAGARLNPLFLFVTTEGYSNENSPWAEMRKFAHQILQGIVTADHFFCVIFAVDEEDDEYDPKVWIKANPIMEVNPILAKEIAKEAIEAKQMPGKAAEFRVKRLNKPSASADSFIDLTSWNKCNASKTLDELEGATCWGSLDLASNRDLVSFRILWYLEGKYYTHGWRYCPSEAIHFKNLTGTSKYPGWVEEGLLLETKGKTNNHEIILKNIVEQVKRFKPSKLVADDWNTSEIVRKLDENHNIEMLPFIQGPKSYHPAIKKFEKSYIDGELGHCDDPILKWCATNLVVKRNENANMMPDKKRSTDKIDDIVTLIMCYGASLDFKPKRSLQSYLDNKVSINL